VTGGLGTSRRRLEGGAKVTGSAGFTADLRVAGMAHVALVLSTVASARIRSIDTRAAAATPGVLLVATGADLAGDAGPSSDLLLTRERVHHVGQPVAAVVAESEYVAADAALLVSVEYESLPAALDTAAATREDAPLVGEAPASAPAAGAHGATVASSRPEGLHRNVTGQVHLCRGDAAAAMAACAEVHEARYSVAPVHHGSIEPHVAVVRAELDGGLTIWAPTQGQFQARAAVAGILRIPVRSVRVVPMPVGGGFGGKVVLLEPLLALLSRRCGRPVRLQLTRAEEFLVGRGCSGCTVDVRLGADVDGCLRALVVRLVFDNGAGFERFSDLAAGVFVGSYRLAAYDVLARDVRTNKTPTTTYRAPGAAPACFALESAVDDLARRLGIDPVELRLRNAIREGDPAPDGGTWPSVGLEACLLAVRAHPLYTSPLGPGEGVGVAVGGWGGACEPASAECVVETDGTVTLRIGASDITGTDTTLAMLTAAALGVTTDRVRIERGDTATAPYACLAAGSQVVYSVGSAAHAAALRARERLLQLASEALEADVGDLEVRDGAVGVRGLPDGSIELGALAALGGGEAGVRAGGRSALRQRSPMFTAHVTRVKVDPESGAWLVTGYHAVQDVGRALNPAEIEGQVHGGVAQGLGRVTGEELVHDEEGQLRTTSFADYGIPTIDQVPATTVALVEIPSPLGPLGARGVGEIPAVPGAAALANAIASAAGVRPHDLPVHSELLLASLEGR
jgi:CO/xanthine dehydrogenase Mo-binding subunit